MKKIFSIVFTVGILLAITACSKETTLFSSLPDETISASSSPNEKSTVSSSTTASIAKNRPEGIPEDYEITTVELPAVDTSNWITNTYTVSEKQITLTLPPDIGVENFFEQNDRLYFTIPEDSSLNELFQVREESIGSFRFISPHETWLANNKIDNTHYAVPEVGQTFDYYYNENFESATFYYFEDYIVFVAGSNSYLPLDAYELKDENALNFYFWSKGNDSLETYGIIQEIIKSAKVNI